MDLELLYVCYIYFHQIQGVQKMLWGAQATEVRGGEERPFVRDDVMKMSNLNRILLITDMVILLEHDTVACIIICRNFLNGLLFL